MAAGKVPERICSVCRLGDGPLVPARYVVRAPDGAEWFECVECMKLDAVHGHAGQVVTVVGLYEWFRRNGLLYPPT